MTNAITLSQRTVLMSSVALLVPALIFADPATGRAPETFSTAEAAAKALIHASAKNNVKALLKIFGDSGKEIIESGDPKEDQRAQQQFAQLAKKKMELLPDNADPNKKILSIGDNDWPFPIPLVRANNLWSFDTSQGKAEILARRIGANEMSAIEVCQGYVDAQREYAQNHHVKGVPEYAQHIPSTPGKQDGLYWDASPGSPAPDVPKAFAKAAALSKDVNPEPYQGYYFHILTAQGKDAPGGEVSYIQQGAMIGGFAFVAWPAEYGASGVQTFIVGSDGTVYEKDLGPDTAAEVQKMTEYDPDSSWHQVQE